MAATLVVQLAKHFKLHECLCEQDLVANRDEWPVKYVHHFFPDVNKLTWTEDFSVHIFYIPTTFDVHVKVKGIIVHHDVPETADEATAHEWVINTLEKAQVFPGGFMRSEDDFRNRLKALSGSPPAKKIKRDNESSVDASQCKLRINLTGVPCARIDLDDSYMWLIEVAVPGSNEEEMREDSPPNLPRPFSFVHRRIEWLMHFHIDALSGIELDPRWRIFVPIRFFSNPDPLEVARGNIAKSESKTPTRDKEDAVVKIARNIHTLSGNDPDSLLETGAAMTAVLEEAHEPFEILGLVTVFQFFCLPLDRARVSQFYILPHRQRMGIGRKVLSALTELLCNDPNIREISVEDPAPEFQRLRDIVSIDLAIQKGLLKKECLYPTAEVQKAIKAGKTNLQVISNEISPSNPEEWPRYSSVLRKVQKENSGQRRRMKLMLILARIIPSSVLLSTDSVKRVEGSAAARKRVTDDNTEAAIVEWQRQSPVIKEIRVAEKRRFRLESLEWYDNQRTLADVQAELESEWLQLFLSLCGSLRVIRKSNPIDE